MTEGDTETGVGADVATDQRESAVEPARSLEEFFAEELEKKKAAAAAGRTNAVQPTATAPAKPTGGITTETARALAQRILASGKLAPTPNATSTGQAAEASATATGTATTGGK